MLVLLVGMPLLFGCGGDAPGPKTAKVSGVVTYKGQPVVGATVSFNAPKSPRTGVGITNDKGEFIIGTFGTNDGAVLGDHVVTVVKNQGSLTPMMKPEDMTKSTPTPNPGGGIPQAMMPNSEIKNELPAKYAKDSPLKAKVEAGAKNEFKFDLTD